jgi:hypothetical protein
MYQIFYPFGYGDLPIVEDRARNTAEVMKAVVAVISVHTAAVVTIADKPDRSAIRAAADTDRVDQFDLFF